MGDIVKNVVGTARRKCCCSVPPKTWLAHWERGTNTTLNLLIDKCYAKGCPDLIAVGAHVFLLGSDLRTVWIAPFCQWHNKRPSHEEIELKWGVVLVAAAKIDCA